MTHCPYAMLTTILIITGCHQSPSKIYNQSIERTWSAECVSITDGDTIKVLDGTTQVRIRLASIDTPERNQPFGLAAKKTTGEMCHGKQVTIHQAGTDRWGRVIAFVIVDGKNVNAELINRGLAWHYRKYSQSKELQSLEDKAKQSKSGLWADPNPIPPWEWRR